MGKFGTEWFLVKVYKVVDRKKSKDKFYVRRLVKVPCEFPDVETAVLLTVEEFEKLRATFGTERNPHSVPKNLVDGFYYVLCPDCGKIAHLTVEYKNSEAWYYCPYCNYVFPKTRRGGK